MSDRLDIKHAYQTLGLKFDASQEQVKQAYRQLAKTWHPDRFTDPQQKREAEEKIKKINQAIEDSLLIPHPAKYSRSARNILALPLLTHWLGVISSVTKIVWSKSGVWRELRRE
jgi:preprotein translocase subunit Sec63